MATAAAAGAGIVSPPTAVPPAKAPGSRQAAASAFSRAGSALRQSSGRAVAVLALVGGLVAVGGCATATPLCDDGKAQAGAGALARATETYARASRAGEGECATAGLAAAGSSYADAFVNVDRGRAAEDSH